MADLFSFFSPGHHHEKPSIQPLLIEIDINKKLFLLGAHWSLIKCIGLCKKINVYWLHVLGYTKKKKKKCIGLFNEIPSPAYLLYSNKIFKLAAKPTPTCQLKPTEEG
jgi:hypothetical protein